MNIIEGALLSVLNFGRLRLVACAALGTAIAQSAADQVAAQTCPNPPAISSSQPPADVCIPSGFSGNPIAFFDDYSCGRS